MAVQAVRIVPLEVVLRNRAAGSLCRQLPLAPDTRLEPALLDLYFKDDALGDPLLTEARLDLLGLLQPGERERLEALARQVNAVLSRCLGAVGIDLVDFKLEFGRTDDGTLLLADEISPDTCRLWDRGQAGSTDRILDKDRFRQDLGGLVEAYGEVLKRVQGLGQSPRPYR
jgi:phosphoribosylaminoimidazole-succinocarboxamide synthase